MGHNPSQNYCNIHDGCCNRGKLGLNKSCETSRTFTQDNTEKRSESFYQRSLYIPISSFKWRERFKDLSPYLRCNGIAIMFLDKEIGNEYQ